MQSIPVHSGSSEVVEALKARLRQLETPRRGVRGLPSSSGCAALDQVLPERGFARGTLVEWLQQGPGSGAGTLALAAARGACGPAGPLLVVDGQRQFYPPAAQAAGIDLGQTIMVRTSRPEDETWAVDQALRCGGVGAVLCWADRFSQRTMRRLQLAAERSGGLGLLVRPVQVRSEPCWAALRLLVQPLSSQGPRRLRVELLRGRGVLEGTAVELELDDETSAVHLVSPVAPSASVRRSTSA